MNPQNKKLVMFDFDGVLVNTIEISYQIHKIKNKDLTWERFQSFHDGNFLDGIGKAIKEGLHVVSDDFYGQYKKKLDLLTIHDILHDAILHLATYYNLIMISSTRSSLIMEFISKENLSGCFSEILGQDIHSSKIVKIKSMLDKYKLLPSDAVFITDTLGDIKEANECGVISIGVTWGAHSRETLQKGSPAVIIDDPQDLVSAIENVLK